MFRRFVAALFICPFFAASGEAAEDTNPADLQAAFLAAFGHKPPFTMAETGPGFSADWARSGNHLIYEPSALVDVTPGTVALISKGTLAEFHCHACDGALAVHYLKKEGTGFSLVGAWPAIGGEAGFGESADWSIRTDLENAPVMMTKSGWAGMGCSVTSIGLIALTPDGPIVREEGFVLNSDYDGGVGPDPSTKYNYHGQIMPLETGKRFAVQYSGTRQFRVEYVRKGDVYVPDSPEPPGC